MAYTTRSNIEQFYGTDNVTKWADLDNDADAGKITARITAAITWADGEINDSLRGGPYTVPFTSTPSYIEDISTKLAGARLYQARGTQDFDPDTGEEVDRLTGIRNDAKNRLMRLRTGQVQLDATTTITYPEVVEDEDEDETTGNEGFE